MSFFSGTPGSWWPSMARLTIFFHNFFSPACLQNSQSLPQGRLDTLLALEILPQGKFDLSCHGRAMDVRPALVEWRPKRVAKTNMI